MKIPLSGIKIAVGLYRWCTPCFLKLALMFAGMTDFSWTSEKILLKWTLWSPFQGFFGRILWAKHTMLLGKLCHHWLVMCTVAIKQEQEGHSGTAYSITIKCLIIHPSNKSFCWEAVLEYLHSLGLSIKYASWLNCSINRQVWKILCNTSRTTECTNTKQVPAKNLILLMLML